MTRRILATLAAATVAGVAAILALDAAARAWGNPGAAVLLGIAAAWLGQTTITLLITTRRPR